MSDILVQRGTTDVGNTGTTTGITAVSSLTSAFEFNSNSMFTHGGSTSSGGNMEGDDMSGSIELTATNTLTFTRQSGSLAQNMRFDWQVIEYVGSPGGANEFIVRSRNTITMSGNSGSASLDTAPGDNSKCIPFITGVRTSQISNNGDELRATAFIDGTGTLQVRKGSSTNTTVVQVVTVEFTGSNWTVHQGTVTSSADTGNITLGTSVTDWADAFIVGQFTSTDQGLDSIACRYRNGGANNQVAWDFQSGNSSSHIHQVYALENSQMAVTRFTPVGSLANDTNIDITSAGLTALNESMIIGTCQGSGGGTAYGRNWRNYRLTSTTNAQHYCHRSGNTINHGVEVIDFSGVLDAGGGTDVTVSLSPLNATYSLVDPTASTEQSASVALTPLSATYTLSDPTVSTGQSVSVSLEALSGTFSLSVGVSTAQGVNVSLGALNGSWDISTDATTQQNASVSVNILDGVWSIEPVTVVTAGSAIVSLSPLTGNWQLVDPAVIAGGSTTVDVGVLEATWMLTSAVSTGSSTSVALSPLTGSWEISSDVSTEITASINLSVLEGNWTLEPISVIATSPNATVSLEALSANWELSLSVDAQDTINQGIKRIYNNTMNLRQINFYLGGRFGNEGYFFVNKFGRNPDIDTGSGPEDVWSVGGIGVLQTSAQVLNISSDSANDTLAGTGARSVKVFGLDANLDQIEEVVPLNGTTPVQTTQQFLRTFRAFVHTAGDSLGNEGTIDIFYATSGDQAAQIVAGLGQTEMAYYTVPRQYTALLMDLEVSMNKQGATSGAMADVALMVQKDGVIIEKYSGAVSVEGSSRVMRVFNPPLMFEEGTDIWVRVLNVSDNNTDVSATFDLICVLT